MRSALAILLLASCAARPSATPRWLIAKRDVVASDDPAASLRRGFGIAIAEAHGDRVRSAEGHWYARDAFDPATPLEGPAPAAPPAAIARPLEVGPSERWVDVELSAQRVTAYEGDRPIRAMKTSTGVGDEGAPYSTPRGVYRIYAKLPAATMTNPQLPGAAPDPHPYRFDGVPDVQYFYKHLALHGAYWHRRFGQRVSHGCVNLAPADAAWLYDFTPSFERGKSGAVVRVR